MSSLSDVCLSRNPLAVCHGFLTSGAVHPMRLRIPYLITPYIMMLFTTLNITRLVFKLLKTSVLGLHALLRSIAIVATRVMLCLQVVSRLTVNRLSWLTAMSQCRFLFPISRLPVIRTALCCVACPLTHPLLWRCQFLHPFIISLLASVIVLLSSANG